MAKSVQVSKERLEELTRVLHLRALRRMMQKQPQVVHVEAIESNRGRQDKAVRVLLHRQIMYRTNVTDVSRHHRYASGSAKTGYWPSTLQDRVGGYAAEHRPSAFEDDVREDLENMSKDTTHGMHTQSRDASRAGWRAISNAPLPQLAHMHEHRGEYLFMDDALRPERGADPSGDPLPWEDVEHPGYYATVEGMALHEKLVLRNIAEIHAREHFHRLIQTDTGLLGASKDYDVEVSISNLGYLPPSEDNLRGIDGACREAVRAILRYRKGCRCLMQAVRSHGGEGAYRNEIVRRAVRYMIDMAPVALASADGGRNDLLARYLMEHADGHTLESLFDDRPPVLKSRGEDDGLRGSCIRDPLDRTFKKILGIEDSNP